MNKSTEVILDLPDPANYKVISFDIFDTSVLRLVFEPRHVFLFMEEELIEKYGKLFVEFADLRFRAELETVSKVWAQNRASEANLDDIYETLFVLKPALQSYAQDLKETELCTERSLTVPNRQILDYYNKALQLQKTLIFVSDTYLPKSYIAQMIEDCGYKGYEKLFVSCEVGTNKASGQLFDVVIQELGIDPKHILHIGDNQHGDVIQAASRGINSYKIPYSAHLLKSSRYEDKTYSQHGFRETINESLLKGIQKNYLMNREQTTLPGNLPGYDIGFQILGPLLYGFVNWLLQHAQQKEIQQLYFISREGWLLKQAFDIFNLVAETGITSHYLYASRRALFVPFLNRSTDDFRFAFLMSGKPTKIGDYIKALDLEITDERLKELGYESRQEWVDAYSPSHQAKIQAFFEAEAEQIERLASKEKADYLEYLHQMGLLSTTNIGVVDSGWFGNGQKQLYRFLKEANPNANLFGFYIALHQEAKQNFSENSSGYGYLHHFYDFNNDIESFLEIARIIELFLSAPSESLKKMIKEDGVIRPVFMKKNPNPVLHPTIQNLHKGALDFVREFASVPLKQPLGLSNHLLGNLLNDFVNAPSKEEAFLIGTLPYDSSSVGSDERKFSFPEVQLKDWLRNPLSLDQEFKRSHWRSAYYENQKSPILRFVLRYTQRYFLMKGTHSSKVYQFLEKLHKVGQFAKDRAAKWLHSVLGRNTKIWLKPKGQT